MAKKKDIAVNPEDRFYKMYSEMSKVNFLGTILLEYYQDKLLGKEEDSVEFLRLSSIVRVLKEKFND